MPEFLGMSRSGVPVVDRSEFAHAPEPAPTAPELLTRAALDASFEPCPFCAHEISVTSRHVHVGGVMGACSNVACPVGPTLIDTNVKALAQRWNTRGGARP